MHVTANFVHAEIVNATSLKEQLLILIKSVDAVSI